MMLSVLVSPTQPRTDWFQRLDDKTGIPSDGRVFFNPTLTLDGRPARSVEMYRGP
jgi:hypothetical protein